MTRAERLAILGPETIAAIHRRVAQAPPPPPEVLAELRPMFAPALAEVRADRRAAAEQQLPLAA